MIHTFGKTEVWQPELDLAFLYLIKQAEINDTTCFIAYAFTVL
jgi:hypothetical protein